MLALGVSVCIGLAPLLGSVKVPLFSSLLDLIPDFLQHRLIPITSAFMGLAAAAVQWNAEEKLSRARRRKVFRATLWSASCAALVFYVISTFAVKNVDFGGKDSRESGSFLVGFFRPLKPPCAEGISDAECIKRLGFDQDSIRSFWGDTSINVAELVLSGSYLSFMLSFATLVGVVIHKNPG
jgi:hypothetical protein